MAGAAEHSALAGAILKGTATNYLRVAVKLVKTVMLTRILQYHLGVDFYGYWTLLWAVFGYATLLEFGFGRTMQKYAAEGVDTPERLLSFNRIFSAVLASYLGIALALLALSALLAVNLESPAAGGQYRLLPHRVLGVRNRLRGGFPYRHLHRDPGRHAQNPLAELGDHPEPAL